MTTQLTGNGVTQLDALAVAGAADFGTPTYGGVAMGRLVLGTSQATTSGTSINFTSIPSWVKRITVVGRAVSTSGTNSFLVQIGTGGTPTTSGYTSNTHGAYSGNIWTSMNFTAGFGLANTAIAANYAHFSCVLINMGDNVWQQTSYLSGGGSQGVGMLGGGDITLGGVLDNVRLTTSGGTDTFDAGSVNILYEG